MKDLKSSLLWVCATSMATTTGYVAAIEGESDGGPKLEEIVVTATKRSQSTMDVSYNISAIDSSFLKESGIANSAQMMRSVPGLASYDRGPRGNGINSRIIIRGLNVDGSGASEFRQVTVAPVSTYIDEVPMFMNLQFTDIDRVEVLRGPQGTLYGSGSLGGTIRYIHNKPDFESTYGNVEGSVSHTDGAENVGAGFEGLLNIPINEHLAVRFSGGKKKLPGFVNLERFRLDGNTKFGIPDGSGGVDTETASDVNDSNSKFVRSSLRFVPNEDLVVDASYHYQRDTADGRQAQSLSDDFNRLARVDEPFSARAKMYSLEVAWDSAFGLFSWSSSYSDAQSSAISDFSPVIYAQYEPALAAFGMAFDPVQYAIGVDNTDTEITTQEVRWVSPDSDFLEWVVGAYYMEQKSKDSELIDIVGFTTFQAPLSPASDSITDFVRETDIEDIAAFGEVTFNVTEDLSFSAGFRWFDVQVEASQVYLDPATITDLSGPLTKYSDKDVIGKLNVSYYLSENTMLYGTWSQGYRRGGANSLPIGEPDDIRTFDADTVDNYEMGIKSDLNDYTRITGALFYEDWQDIQISTFSPVNTLDAAINGENAFTRGLELEIEIQLLEDLNAEIGYAYTEAELSKDFSVANGLFTAESGNRLPSTPKHMFTGAFNYLDQLSDVTLNYNVNFSYSSETVNDVSKEPLFGSYREFDSFWLVGASITAQYQNLSVSIVGQNLTNESAVTAQNAANYIQGQAYEWVSRPRTLSASVRYEF